MLHRTNDIPDGALNCIAGVGDRGLEGFVVEARQRPGSLGEFLVDAGLGQGWRTDNRGAAEPRFP